MRRSNSRLLISCLAALTAIAAIAVGLAAVPPKNLTKTIEAQRKLVADHPEDPAVYNDLGNLLMLVPKPADAEAAYRKAIELDPNKASALFNLGLLLQQQGELREAEDLYQRTIKADPNHAWASYQLGSIQEAHKQKSKAIDSYARAFALDPQLAFPEVNPRIVDNKLVTEAMLRAYRNDFGANRQVPKMYDDGARIASMLVPPPAPHADDTKDQPATGQPATSSTRQPMLTPKPAGTAGTASGTTVLREQDLKAPAGQAGAPGAARGAAGARPTLGGQQGTVRQWNRPEPTVQDVPGGGGDDDGAQPAPVINPPSGGVYYRPGVQSTGRLNLQVAPVQSARR
ncbi:MAG TPA: tetratricopeptide repeat protein [Thermoanaerobaculia bacterium]|nr:tetratricopeptide repeat protein [Thermoanaerobaculia bacterium]